MKAIRYLLIAVLLFLGVWWSLASAQKEASSYPNDPLLVTAQWVKAHAGESDLLIVDIRADKYFHGSVIPGAIRMPWSQFRFNDPGNNLAETFVGVEPAQKILGEHGITRQDRLVLYDSVERDGGATASYLFWILDLLGHEHKMILNGGIDAWKRAGFAVSDSPERRQPVLYQAPFEAIDQRKLITGDFIHQRLADPYYRIVDVRSRDEYLGEKGTKGLTGNPLKLGHIPTAVNINYQDAWKDEKHKMLKSYPELQALYRGLSPDSGVILYCNSGRRSSFSYFVLRLMGFSDVFTYEPSWKEWGEPSNFYPVERTENKLVGGALPGTGKTSQARVQSVSAGGKTPQTSGGQPKGGYVSCGG